MFLHCTNAKSWLSNRALNCFRFYTTTTPCSQLSAQLLNHLKHNRLQQAHVMISKQPTPVPVHFYNYLLKGYAKNFRKAHTLERSLDVLTEMRLKGVEPSSQSYMQLIMGLALRVTPLNKEEEKWMQRWFDEFLRIESGNTYPKKTFNKFKKLMRCVYYKGHPNLKHMFYAVLNTFPTKLEDVETWNLVIAGCIQSQRIRDAEQVLERARMEQVANSTSFRMVIQAYLVKGDQSSANRVLKHMLQDHIVADKATYEIFIQYCLTRKQKKTSIEMLKQLWQGVLMTTDRGDVIHPEITVLLTNYYKRRGALEEAEQMYLDMKYKQLIITKEHLQALNEIIIQFVNKQQYISAVSLIFDLVGQGYTLNQETITHITQSLEANNQFETIEQLTSVIPLLKPHDLTKEEE